jgi:hypothetical protein
MNKKSLLTRLCETIDDYRAAQHAQPTTSQNSSYLRRFLRWLTPNGGTLLLTAILILTQQVWAGPLLGTTNAPGPSATTVNYQGRLADSEGVPLSGTYGMTFTIYDAETDGNIVWGPEIHVAVTVNEGLFSIGLGSLTSGGIPTTVWDGDRYLEIAVNGQTMSPRELIRSVPIAGMALTLPDNTVNGALLSHGGFGSSNVTLNNFVVRGPATADLTVTAEVSEAVWDLRPIIGDSAVMVALQANMVDDAVGSSFNVWPNGETPSYGNRSSARTWADSKNSPAVLWVRCDNEQRINYQIDARSADNVLTELNVTVIGWIEPAATP